MPSQLPKIGYILEGPGPKDAIHVAVVPVLTGEDLEPGDHVRIVHGRAYKAYGQAIGIIDPYLDNGLFEGQWVNMFLYPGTITDIRHNWTLPSYDEKAELRDMPRLDEESAQWLENFAYDHNTSYEGLIVRCQEALAFVEQGSTYTGHDGVTYSYVTFYGRDIHHVPEEFWDHFRRATGWEVSQEDIERVVFTCSC